MFFDIVQLYSQHEIIINNNKTCFYVNISFIQQIRALSTEYIQNVCALRSDRNKILKIYDTEILSSLV